MSLERIKKLPCWSGAITAEPLTGGLSNESWKVVDATGLHVVRFGSDYPVHHVDRAREVMSARAAHAAGFAPAVEYADEGVMVSAYVSSRTWGPSDVSAAPERVGELLARFHRDMGAHMSGAGFVFWPFHVIRDYARTIGAGAAPLPTTCRVSCRWPQCWRPRRPRCPSSWATTTCCPPIFLMTARGCG